MIKYPICFSRQPGPTSVATLTSGGLMIPDVLEELEEHTGAVESVPSDVHLTSGPASPYARYWHPIARSRDVTDRPRRYMLLGEPLVAFRTSDGLGVLKDLCIHRGAQLSMGWVKDDLITCPYHGFQYDVTGRCRRIPSIPADRGVPKKVNAIGYPSQEAYGLIWVALADPVAPIPPWPEWDDPEWRITEPWGYSWKASAGRIKENFLDIAHFPFVHPGLLSDPDDTLVEPYHQTLEATPHGLTFYVDQHEPAAPDTDQGETIRLTYSSYMPFNCHLFKQSARGDTHVPIWLCPTSAAQTEVFCTVIRNVDPEPEKDAEYIHVVATAALEDQRIVESQRPELLPLDLAEEMHIKVPDAAGVMYRRLLRAFEEGSFTPTW
jgi:phenylpropionate dioxygenase-like ring-hydroxylating dioxygenase large terminal subunit